MVSVLKDVPIVSDTWYSGKIRDEQNNGVLTIVRLQRRTFRMANSTAVHLSKFHAAPKQTLSR